MILNKPKTTVILEPMRNLIHGLSTLLLMCSLTSAAEQIGIRWDVPATGVPYAPITAHVGDAVVFAWLTTEKHNVYRHPYGNCSEAGAILVGEVTGSHYTFLASDAGKNITFACDVETHCENGQIITVSVSAAVATAAPTTAAPVSNTTTGTAAPNTTGVTTSPDATAVTAAPDATVVTTAPASSGIAISWTVPDTAYTDEPAQVGDTVTFTWDAGQTHNVYIHPSGNCTTTGAMLVGNTSGASYTFVEADAGKVITFACEIGMHCDNGQIINFTVTGEASTDASVTSTTTAPDTTTDTTAPDTTTDTTAPDTTTDTTAPDTTVTTAPASSGILIKWSKPDTGTPYKNEPANVGDTVTFTWPPYILHNVYKHPTGDCTTDNSVAVGFFPDVSYTFVDADAGKNITFACDIVGHCENGQIITFSVAGEATNVQSTDSATPAHLRRRF